MFMYQCNIIEHSHDGSFDGILIPHCLPYMTCESIAKTLSSAGGCFRVYISLQGADWLVGGASRNRPSKLYNE